MKSILTLLVLVLLLLNILAGCAPGPNQSKGTASEQNVVAGFWLGLWQGFIAPFVFVASLFKSNLSITRSHGYPTRKPNDCFHFGFLAGHLLFQHLKCPVSALGPICES